MTNKLPQRVKELREAKGLSQLALATELNVSSGFIGDIELGRCSVSVDTLIMLANFFEESTDYLLGLVD